MVSGVSDYEELRQRNIARNNEILSALAIDSSAHSIGFASKESKKGTSDR